MCREAAFYGPKIDFVVKDVIGREWQLGHVMIHREPFGSMERFCGVIIEHFAGAFPTWLNPEQVRVMTISKKSTNSPVVSSSSAKPPASA